LQRKSRSIIWIERKDKERRWRKEETGRDGKVREGKRGALQVTNLLREQYNSKHKQIDIITNYICQEQYNNTKKLNPSITEYRDVLIFWDCQQNSWEKHAVWEKFQWTSPLNQAAISFYHDLVQAG